MRLEILLPDRVFLEQEVTRLFGESQAGNFCLLPRHIDYVTGLALSILSFFDTQEKEHFCAVDGGILVKQGPLVRVATRRAVSGPLGELEEEIDRMLSGQDQTKKKTQTAVARLEAGFLRQFMGLTHG